MTTSRMNRQRQARLAAITSYAKASLQAPAQCGFIACLSSGGRVVGVVTDLNESSVRVATAGGERVLEIADIDSGGSYNI